MSDSFPNTIHEGVPWSADLEPDGSDPAEQVSYRTRLSQNTPSELERDLGSFESQDEPRDLYDGLPPLRYPKGHAEH